MVTTLTDEPLTAQTLALIVKHYAEAAVFDFDKLSGHSLRAGFVTSAAADRGQYFPIMESRSPHGGGQLSASAM